MNPRLLLQEVMAGKVIIDGRKAKDEVTPKKAMKARKAMKAMVSTTSSKRPAAAGKAVGGKKKKKRVSTIARASDYKRKGWARRAVWAGRKTKTSGGLMKRDLMCNKRGRIVSKKSSANAQKRFSQNGIGEFLNGFMEARRDMGITGFVALKKTGGTKQQTELFRRTVDAWTRKLYMRLSDTRKKHNLSGMDQVVEEKKEMSSSTSAAPAAAAASTEAAPAPASAPGTPSVV